MGKYRGKDKRRKPCGWSPWLQRGDAVFALLLKGYQSRVAEVRCCTRPGTVADLFEAYVQYLKGNDKPSWIDVEKGLNKVTDTLGPTALPARSSLTRSRRSGSLFCQ